MNCPASAECAAARRHWQQQQQLLWCALCPGAALTGLHWHSHPQLPDLIQRVLCGAAHYPLTLTCCSYGPPVVRPPLQLHLKPKHPTAAVLQMLMQMDTQQQLQALPQGRH